MKTPNKGWGWWPLSIIFFLLVKSTLGIFAGKRIPSGTFVGIYAGEIITDEEGERRGRWVTLRL